MTGNDRQRDTPRDAFADTFLRPEPESFGAVPSIQKIEPAALAARTKRPVLWTAAVAMAAGLSFASPAPAASPPQWLLPVHRSGATALDPWGADLARLAELKAGWDGYDAEPPSERAFRKARDILSAAEREGPPPTHVGASVEGGLCVTFEHSGLYADIECFNDGSLIASVMAGGTPTAWDVPAKAGSYSAALRRIRGLIGRES